MYAAPARLEQPVPAFTSGLSSARVARISSRVISSHRSGFGESDSTDYVATPAPRLVRSVVDEAGLGRFVYLQGKSGRRYVFSSIRREQVALYDHALFASSTPGSDEVQVSAGLDGLSQRFSTLYVHLLDNETCDAERALNDLGA